MALVAIEANAQKKMRSVFKSVFGSSQDLVVRRGGVFSIRAGCSNDIMHKLVIGFVGGNALSNPFAEFGRSLFTQKFRIDLQQVRPLTGPVVYKRFAGNQLVNKFFPLFLDRRWVCQKRSHLICRWRKPGQVQSYSSQKISIIANPRRLDLHAFPFRGHNSIDRVFGIYRLPVETGSITHDCQRCRRIGSLVSS